MSPRGILAELATQGMPPKLAKPGGFYLHGLDGEVIADTLSPYLMLAGNISTFWAMPFKCCCPIKNFYPSDSQ